MSPLSAQNSFRIKRNQSSAVDTSSYQDNYLPAGSATASKPLKGGVEQRDFVPHQYQMDPMQGKTDGTELRAGARSTGPLNASLYDRGAPLSGAIGKQGLQPGIPMFGQSKLPPFPMDAKQTRLPGDVSDHELNKLKSFDVVIMQDRSSSMGEHEGYPQGYFPRWYWCMSQAMDFRRQTMRLPSWTFNLVLFSSKYDVYRNVSMAQLPSIFNRDGIWIGTKLAPPMAQTLDEFFQRRTTGKARPLIIAVITDGKPNDDHNLADLICNATRHMQAPGEIHITFLQVGTDGESYRKLNRLDNGLVYQGARYDIVSVMPFSQVTQMGLTRALVSAVQTAAATSTIH